MLKRVFPTLPTLFLSFALFCLALGSLGIDAGGQSPQGQDEEPTISIGTELMQIDAVVTDKQGRLVDALTKDDFILFEDGKPQDVAFFSIVRGDKPVGVPATRTDISVHRLAAEPSGRTEGRVVVLMVDDLHIARGNMPRVKQALIDYVKTQFREGDRIAVATTGGGFASLQQLTSNMDEVQTAIGRLTSRKRQAVIPTDPARLTESQAQAILQGDPEALGTAVETYVQNTQASYSAAEQIVRSTSREIVSSLASQTSATLASLGNVVSMLRKVPGRKALLFVGDGFPLEFGERNHAPEIRAVIDAATRSGVVIYSIDSSGLVALNPTGRDISAEGGTLNSAIDTSTLHALESGEVTALTQGLKALARETGGFAVINTNDLRGAFQKIARDNEVYYLLAYHPENTRQDGKFRELKIVVKNRPDLVVRTRKGYVAPDAKKLVSKNPRNAEIRASTEELQRALSSVVPPDNLDIKSTGCFLPTEREGKFDNVNVSLAIRLGSVEFRQVGDHRRNDLNSVLLVINEEGKVTSAFEDTIVLKFPDKHFNETLKSWFFFNKRLSLPPGLYNLRFAVHDPLGNAAGTTSEWLRIPDLSKPRMAMSTIFLLHGEGSKGRDEKSAGQADSSGMPKGFQPGVQALRQFSTEETLGFVTYIYNVPPNKPDLTVQIQIWKDGAPVLPAFPRTIPVKPDRLNRVAYGAQLPLAGLARGRYRLKLIVVDRAVTEQVSQDQDFNVR